MTRSRQSPKPSDVLLLCALVWTLAVFIPPPSTALPALDNMRAEMGSQHQTPDNTTNTTATTSTSLPPSSDEPPTEEEEEDDGQKTQPGYNCSQSHRPHSNDTNKFQVLHNMVWWDQVCQKGLVWNQTLCRCEYQQYDEEGFPPTMLCTDYREHANNSGKYEQRVNDLWLTRDCNLAVAGLVWNQTACRCVWGRPDQLHQLTMERNTPCDSMLNITFDKGLIDEAKGSFLELSSGSTVSLRRYQEKKGLPNKAAYFEGATLSVWYFAGNEMSGSLRVELRFKAEDRAPTRERYQILLSNGCNVTGVGYTTPSLAIGYRASDRSFLLALHTANVRKAIVCTRDLKPFAWHHLSLIYEDGTLLFRVDNHPCIISNDFSGDVQKTQCPLTIGADPLEKESKYYGYMDDVMVARYCRRFVEQTLVPDPREEAAAGKGADVKMGSSVPSKPVSDNASGPAGNVSRDSDTEQEESKDNRIQPYHAMGALI